MHPFGFGLCLNLVTDDAWPHRAVHQDKIGVRRFDFATSALESFTQATPAGVLFRCEERMWESGTKKAFTM